ncbi:ROK family glucokinase [Streptomyces olivoverticillatus]
MGLTIGVDIGGTKIAAGVVDEEGSILATCKVPTPGTPEGVIDAIADAVRTVSEGFEVEAVGIGAAGYVDDKRATVLFAPPTSTGGTRRSRTRSSSASASPSSSRTTPTPPPGASTASAPSQGHDDVICITLGTGLGGGIIIGNKLRRGRFGVAAEFGHIRVVPDGLQCGCGSQGCWEQYASGRALVRYARQRAQATPENAEILLGLGDGTPEGIQGKHISDAARQGDPVAIDSFRELARWAGAGLADLASLFDPSAFIVGGGVSDEGDLVLEPIRKSFRRWLVGSQWRPHAQVLAAQLGGKAGLVGAADLARQG